MDTLVYRIPNPLIIILTLAVMWAAWKGRSRVKMAWAVWTPHPNWEAALSRLGTGSKGPGVGRHRR